MTRTGLWMVAAVTLLFLGANQSRGQNINGGGVAFAPEISIVESGAKLDTQATVSADRKYVTLTMRPQVAQLIALRDFVFQSGNGGPVGIGGNGANGNPNNGAAGPAGANAGANNRPATSRNGAIMPALVKPTAPTPILLQEGMQRVDQPAQR